MGKTKFEKGSEEYEMFTDFWMYCQKFWIAEDNNHYWQELVDATDILEDKYNKNKLLCAWMASFISQKELEFHKLKGDSYGEDGKTSSTM